MFRAKPIANLLPCGIDALLCLVGRMLLGKSVPQFVHRFAEVLCLRAFILTLHSNPGRDVPQPHRGFHLVDVLSAVAAGPFTLHFDLAFIENEVGIVICHHRYRYGRCLPATRAFSRRYPLDAMYTALAGPDASCVLAFYPQNNHLCTQPTALNGLDINCVTNPLGIPLVHTDHIENEQGGIVTTFSGADL